MSVTFTATFTLDEDDLRDVTLDYLKTKPLSARVNFNTILQHALFDSDEGPMLEGHYVLDEPVFMTPHHKPCPKEIIMSERLTLFIDVANDAFANSPTGEIARILRNYARALERGTIDPSYTPLTDINGNRVGEAQINSIGDD